MKISASLHRWLGIGLTLPLLAWTLTGLLFLLKPGWQRAYEQLTVERAVGSLDPSRWVWRGSPAALVKLELFDTALGPMFRASRASSVELLAATTGRVISPLVTSAVRVLAVDAVARSPHAKQYGEPREITLGPRSALVQFSGGPTLELDRYSARLTQRGPDTQRIDWLYRLHYLQWTGIASIDKALASCAIVCTWLLAGFGIVLFARRPRSKRPSSLRSHGSG